MVKISFTIHIRRWQHLVRCRDPSDNQRTGGQRRKLLSCRKTLADSYKLSAVAKSSSASDIEDHLCVV
ncbi:hypothetical protein KIN20_006685 [Parelaphostrongylus tenuis]|uniref:Uncharacterized protein n=1 Tax=Parelaphostrongylus tenuis TaxID=148309 RepID=A0AAD5QL87_PARTN|nr:hypothetical protein KIN20_006685 [Parelaphostrongylus tenuis]